MTGYREEVISFTAGASITYIFVQLLPEFHRIALDSTELIFVFPLAGFSSIHLLEKYLAKSGIPEEQVRKDYGEIHSVFLLLYHGAIGYLIASLLAESTVSGLLFFIPVVMHIAVSSFSLSELHESVARRPGVKVAVSVAPLLGVVFHQAGIVSRQLFDPLFGTVIGMFFYVVIRDSIPGEEVGCPREFIVGMLVYLSVILVANSI